MATANMQQEKPLVEGWWLKKGGNLAKAKHRYLILTERFLDWYEKPGYPRKGTLSLDRIYVRKHGDNVSLILGEMGGKEYRLTSEGNSPAARVNDWYDRIINQMDVVKQRNQHGADRKQIISAGFDDKTDKAQVVKTGEITMVQQAPPQTTATLVTPPPTLVNAQGQTVATFNAPPQVQQVQLQPQINPMVTVVPQPQPVVQQVVSPVVTVSPGHTTTAIGPYGQTTTYTSAPAPAPVTATTTYGPFGAQTTYTASPYVQPTATVTRTSYGPYGPVQTITQAPPTQIITCMACRAQFQGQIGAMTRCPYCQFVSAGGAVIQQAPAPAYTTTTVGYAPAPFY